MVRCLNRRFARLSRHRRSVAGDPESAAERGRHSQCARRDQGLRVGGMSIIARAARADHFEASADAVGIPYKGMHRVASMASGGMASLPHNGAVITLLVVTGCYTGRPMVTWSRS